MFEASLYIVGISIACLAGALLMYPVLQAFGFFSCNCGKKPEDKWQVSEDRST